MAGSHDLAGRNILITGANSGIGRTTAIALARRGARLFLAGRSRAKTEEVLAEIRAAGPEEPTFFTLDLENLHSVRACAAEFLALGVPLHVLINNAGLGGIRGLTKDGFEITFGVNYLGPFLLTELLRDRLQASAPSRVVNVSSVMHNTARKIDWDALRRKTKSMTAMPEYGVSKLCNILHAKELARRLEGTGVTTYALHPGAVASNVWREIVWPFRQIMMMFMLSVEEGAQTSIHCATAPEAARETGLYYEKSRPKEPSSIARDAALAKELWDRSVQWTAAG